MKNRIRFFWTLAVPALFVVVFSLWGLLRPADAVSVSERRALTQLPDLTLSGLASGRDTAQLDTYALDQFPLRDGFRRLAAQARLHLFLEKDTNDIYVADGYAAKLDSTLDTNSVDYAAGRFRFLYDRYLAGTDVKIYQAVVPDKGYYLASAHGYPAMDYDALFARLKEAMPYASDIDLTGTLSPDDYYRTDVHWRQEALPDTARYLAAQMGVTLTDFYTVRSSDFPFYGVYYGQSALPLEPDRLCWLEAPWMEGCTVYDYETDTVLPLYNQDLAAGNDPYALFLSGSKALLRIDNPNAATDRALVVFRDSFGSSIVPLLAEGYRTVTLVDIRYLSPALLGRYLTFTDQDALFLYSTSVLNHSETLQ